MTLLRLPPEEYRKLCQKILERDGWKCQACGLRQRLHIHHIVFRSHGGEDTLENLIALCSDCHDAVHRGELEWIP